MAQIHDLIVIGTGIAGLAAARQALQGGMSTAVMEALLFGGLVVNVNELDGEIAGSGADLASGLMMEVHKLGGENVAATATAIEGPAGALLVRSDAGEHRARAVIVASGARLRRLNVPGEAEMEGRGVSQCADCDGPFFQKQDVVVVGGGDSALQEALVMAGFAQQVHLVHRGERFSGRPHFVDQVLGRANIAVHWRTTVEAILGEKTVRAVRVHDAGDPAATEIPCGGVFAYVGLEPACEFVPAEVGRDARGFLLTDAGLQTSVPGVFAAGAVRSGYGGLLTHAIAEGTAAANSAAAMLRA